MQNAVKNAYTYLIANPTDKMTLENLKFYMEQKDFNRETMLVDLLQFPFEVLFFLEFENFARKFKFELLQKYLLANITLIWICM